MLSRRGKIFISAIWGDVCIECPGVRVFYQNAKFLDGIFSEFIQQNAIFYIQEIATGEIVYIKKRNKSR